MFSRRLYLCTIVLVVLGFFSACFDESGLDQTVENDPAVTEDVSDNGGLDTETLEVVNDDESYTTENETYGPEVVATKYGLVEGIYEDDLMVFKGIPYAKPPVGELRYHSPEEPESWTGIRSAKEFGAICAQMPLLNIAGDIVLSDYERECEDCLFLNIWTPAADNEKRPVMFWIHGGAAFYGSGSQPFYPGNILSSKGDVVVVTINYRMGVFGNLADPGLMDEHGNAGNWGLLDMIAALKWVRANIEAFGGDPENVTIFGESAGGWAVCALCISPETWVDGTRLFKRAISESPAIDLRTMDEAIVDAKRFFWRAGCEYGNFDCLRNLSFNLTRLADDMIFEILPPVIMPLFYGNAELKRFLDWNVIPVIDGAVIPKSPAEAIKAGWTKDLDIIIGTNQEECDLLGYILGIVLPHYKIMDYISAIVPGEMPDGTEKAEVMYDAYLEGLREADVEYPGIKVFGNILSDYIFRIKAVKFAEMHKAAGGDGYMYQFVFPLFSDQTFHFTEVPYVFGTLKFPGLAGYILDYNGYPAAVRLKNAVQDAWLNFAKTGIPDINTDEVTLTWPQYDAKNRSTMILGKDSMIVDAPEEIERAVWDEVDAEFYGFD